MNGIVKGSWDPFGPPLSLSFGCYYSLVEMHCSAFASALVALFAVLSVTSLIAHLEHDHCIYEKFESRRISVVDGPDVLLLVYPPPNNLPRVCPEPPPQFLFQTRPPLTPVVEPPS